MGLDVDGKPSKKNVSDLGNLFSPKTRVSFLNYTFRAKIAERHPFLSITVVIGTIATISFQGFRTFVEGGAS